MRPFDIEAAKRGEPVQTLNGKNVRIICFDQKGSSYPVIGLIEIGDREGVYIFCKNGSSNVPEFNLVMAPKKRVIWVNLYPKGSESFSTKEKADAYASESRIGEARRIEIEE